MSRKFPLKMKLSIMYRAARGFESTSLISINNRYHQRNEYNQKVGLLLTTTASEVLDIQLTQAEEANMELYCRK